MFEHFTKSDSALFHRGCIETTAEVHNTSKLEANLSFSQCYRFAKLQQCLGHLFCLLIGIVLTVILTRTVNDLVYVYS